MSEDKEVQEVQLKRFRFIDDSDCVPFGTHSAFGIISLIFVYQTLNKDE